MYYLAVQAQAGVWYDAARTGDIAKVRQLLEQGADANERDKYNQTPLYIAAHWGNTELAILLIEKGADVNTRDKDQNTPAMTAEKRNHHELAAMLRQAGDIKEREALQP